MKAQKLFAVYQMVDKTGERKTRPEKSVGTFEEAMALVLDLNSQNGKRYVAVDRESGIIVGDNGLSGAEESADETVQEKVAEIQPNTPVNTTDSKEDAVKVEFITPGQALKEGWAGVRAGKYANITDALRDIYAKTPRAPKKPKKGYNPAHTAMTEAWKLVRAGKFKKISDALQHVFKEQGKK